MAKKITNQNFNQEVLQSSQPVLVDFYASWCGPCKMLSPVIDELASEADGYSVGKINVDEEPALAAEFKIMSVPTLMVFSNGKVSSVSSGYRPKEQILEMIKKA
ncbi:MAG: thioredoxin [Ruminococcus sp.]|jgi:thioredoxin 1